VIELVFLKKQDELCLVKAKGFSEVKDISEGTTSINAIAAAKRSLSVQQQWEADIV
jgi:hypothetical protein